MNRRGEAHLMVVGVSVAVSAAVTVVSAMQSDGSPPPTNLWAQVLQIGLIGLIGWSAIKKFDSFRDGYAAHREQDAKADAKGREELKEEIAAVEERVTQAAEKDVDSLRTDLQRLDRSVTSLTEALIGSPMHPGGIRAATLRNRERRHDIMNNLANLDAKQSVLAEVVLDIAKAVKVEVSPSDTAVLNAPMRWRQLPPEEG